MNLFTRKEILELRRLVILARAFVRDMTIIGAERSSVRSGAESQWLSLLSHLPHLRAFMVDSLPLPLISSLFDAMSFYSPRVSRITAREYEPSTESSLAEALMPWLEKRHNGAPNCALFSLNVAFVALSNGYPRSTAYVSSLCDWCPTIHSLTGWMQESFDSECNEQWTVDSKTWERFCSTCCSIRKFSWIVVPFKTDFFEVFRKYKKLHLHELTFATASNWLWELYFPETNAKLVYDFGWHAKNVCVVLKACPALQRLRVHLPKPQRTARGTLVADMNQEVFGDEFCEELVRYCPDLDSFTISEVQLSVSDDSPIMSFTDKALLSLSRLRHLKHLDLKAVNMTGVGIFRLIDNVSEHFQVQRHFTIAVGNSHGVKEVDFYAVLRRFFVCLVEHQSALKFITQRISLQLIKRVLARTPPPMSRDWSRAYLEGVLKLVEVILGHHPSLHIHIVLHGYDQDKGFSDISELVLCTKHAEPHENMQLRKTDKRIDDVLVQRC